MFERLIPSMKAIFNSRIVKTSDYLIKTDNRSFCYGDGLFETIVTGPDRINLIEKHISRLKRGCQVLDIDFPALIDANSIQEMINELCEMNHIAANARARLTIWRDTGGLYTPTASSASFYLEVKPSETGIFEKLVLGDFSDNCHTHYSPISFAKTTNALIYVLAGQEKKRKDLDEIILTDNQGQLSETHTSNLFWLKNKQFFTPQLSTGCIDGIMRNTIIHLLRQSKIEVKEVLESKETLINADSVFSTNAAGIKYFSQIGKEKYESPEFILADVIRQLQQP